MARPSMDWESMGRSMSGNSVKTLILIEHRHLVQPLAVQAHLAGLQVYRQHHALQRRHQHLAQRALEHVHVVADRDAAEKLRGTRLYIDRAHAVALDEDSNFLTDLYGLRGVVSDGRDLGKLTEVMQPGGNDVYVFQGPLGEVLVPALKSVVLAVDLEKGEMRLDGKRLDEVAVFDED